MKSSLRACLEYAHHRAFKRVKITYVEKLGVKWEEGNYLCRKFGSDISGRRVFAQKEYTVVSNSMNCIPMNKIKQA